MAAAGAGGGYVRVVHRCQFCRTSLGYEGAVCLNNFCTDPDIATKRVTEKKKYAAFKAAREAMPVRVDPRWKAQAEAKYWAQKIGLEAQDADDEGGKDEAYNQEAQDADEKAYLDYCHAQDLKNEEARMTQEAADAASLAGHYQYQYEIFKSQIQAELRMLNSMGADDAHIEEHLIMMFGKNIWAVTKAKMAKADEADEAATETDISEAEASEAEASEAEASEAEASEAEAAWALSSA
jgi:hypothetical protein